MLFGSKYVGFANDVGVSSRVLSVFFMVITSDFYFLRDPAQTQLL
jgi:hypothetical protein